MSNLSFWDLTKYALRALSYKFEQYRLDTGATAIVNTGHGPVRGAKRLSVWNRAYYSFEAIPYAKPPLGELRFRAPVPVEPWTDILNCTGPAEIPMQGNMVLKKYKGSEDCLYLNIFTNELIPNVKRPVMVWIYGGGFQLGEATRDMYSPDYFMTKDVVLVTIAYRLGPFGFLSLEDPAVNVPGNAGIKDQIMALQWIKENIVAFGGDPNNITVFGESAGGASTHLCMLTERTQGLLHKAIVMSGSVLCPWVLPAPNQWAFRLAKALGYLGENTSKDILEFLQRISAPDIQKAVPTILNKQEKHDRVLFAFGPVIEPYRTDDSVLTENPIEKLRTTWSNSIPLMIGGTSFEGLLFYPEVMRRKATLTEVQDCENLLPFDIPVQRNTPESKDMGLKLKSLYFGEEECNLKTIMEFLEVESYREFWHPIYRTVMARKKYGSKSPTYLYRFDYDSIDGNAIRNLLCGPGLRGASHGDDLCYLFRFIFSHRIAFGSEEHRIAQTMIDIWTSFALHGNPNCESLGEVIFRPVANNNNNDDDDDDDDDNGVKCLNISKSIEFIDLPELKKMAVWNSFYPPGKL